VDEIFDVISNMGGKKVLVVGAGKSGLAVSSFLARRGARVTLADEKNVELPADTAASFKSLNVELCFGGYPEVSLGSFELVVLSPGVPLNSPLAKAARRAGIPLTGELELAFRFLASPLVAITGTNGKTTTTALTGEIFRASGYKTVVAGNIGVPLIEKVEICGPDAVVIAEVSSFQLETVSTFKPRACAILNLTPDHLDRHGSLEGYISAKARIFENQGPGDYTVLNYDDPTVRSLGEKTPGKVVYFSRKEKLARGVWVEDGEIVAGFDGAREVILRADEVGIPGAHNLENALAASALAVALGVGRQGIAGALRSFKGVAHRLEFVAEIGGVRYINDSKGTNPDAAIRALDAYDCPIVLIAGGKNKGSDFSELAAKIKEKVRVLVLLGQSADLIEAAVRKAGFKEIYRAKSFEEAVLAAHRAARPKEVVLLSPACASWDMFNNFEERGDLFKKIVHSLKA